MADTTKVRTTIKPGTVIEVDSAELLDLERQGLIHSRKLSKDEKPRKGEKAWHDGKPTESESGIVTDTTPAELDNTRKESKP